MRAGMEEAFSNSGAGFSAVGKLQRRLPGTAPQNGPPPTGLPQRMGQLQPPVIPVNFETEEMLLHHVPRRAPASFCSQGWDWETPPRREWHLAWLQSPVEEAGLPAAQSSWVGTPTPAPGSESRVHSVRIQPRDVPAAAAGVSQSSLLNLQL
ncbi:uncharacterized protein LOC130265178 isoform X2 [Oenanthe melanoleuca]|uniref:uncharacterized protein LOC130265178 isoform X2 n=1 Tax=Oenanthe melanoleuca TaxID=2939378 RepID=UPI0024C13D83|nr:uncharacterized protein LOC130265178 isoform X2 [Oenanthe melanoleuca]